MKDKNLKIYGIVGYPLAHTMSPAVHNAAFQAKKIKAVYLAFEDEDIKRAINLMRGGCVQGLSVTMPHKENIVKYLDKIEGAAKKIKAVNTVINRNGRLIGYNTDAMAIEKCLNKRLTNQKSHKPECVVLGAGGAARAAAYVVKKIKGRLWVAARDARKAAKLADEFAGQSANISKLPEIDFDILINATPVGMIPKINISPVPIIVLKENQIIFDLIYNPPMTKLLKKAKSKKCKIISGVDMFLCQAEEQFRLWTGERAPSEAMERALRKALRIN